MAGPNYRSQRQFSPRRTRARSRGLSASWDVVGIELLTRDAEREGPRANDAIRKAHTYIAKQQQFEIAEALRRKLADRGRNQRPSKRLLKAIESEKTRNVTLRGFTIGNFEDIPIVRSYYYNLEFGTGVFVDRVIFGLFQNAAGRLSFPRRDRSLQVDPRFIQFGDPGKAAAAMSRGPGERPGTIRNSLNSFGTATTRQPSAIVITHPIQGYHYIQEGTKKFRSYAFKEIVLETYAQFFEEAGIDFLQRWLGIYGDKPSASRRVQETVNKRPKSYQPPRSSRYFS